MNEIHINCDLGEGGEYDQQLMPLISACNIACGGHAGNLETMHHTVSLAMENGVEIGAHPSYPDKTNFGRISLKMPPVELKRSLVAQILSLKQITEAEGAKICHVKPHGALYNDAHKDQKIAALILDALMEFDESFTLYAPEGSVLAEMAEGNFQVRYEAFSDRNYNPDGSLVSRLNSNALITDKEAVFNHLWKMAMERKIKTLNGDLIPCRASTFCLHSDTPDSVNIMKYIHQRFLEKGVKIQHAE